MAELTPKQEKAAVLLIAGKSGVETAKALDISPETVCKWKQIPEFEALMNQLRGDAMESARETIRSTAKTAADTLRSLVTGAESESVRLRACVHLLEYLGFMNLQNGRHGRDITQTDAEEIRAVRKAEKRQKDLLDRLDPMKY